MFAEVDLVNDQKIGTADPGAALARHIATTGHVQHECLCIDQSR